MTEDKKPTINGKDEQTYLTHYNHSDIKSVSEIGLDWAALVDLHDYYRDSMLGPLEIIAESLFKKLRTIKGVYIIKYRVKDPEHLIDKVIRKKQKDGRLITRDNFQVELDDFIGIRILHLFKDGWEEIFQSIRKTFEPKEQPVAYYREGDDEAFLNRCKELGLRLQPRDAGYRSIHYIALVPFFNTIFKCEIQVRTVIEEAWGEVDHIVRYPNNTDDEILNSYLRVFNRLVGCADEMGTFLAKLKANRDQMQEEKQLLLNEIEQLKGKDAKKNRQIDELKKKLERSRMLSWPYIPENPLQSTIDYISSIQNPSGSTMAAFSNPMEPLQDSLEGWKTITRMGSLLDSTKTLTSKFKMPKLSDWKPDSNGLLWPDGEEE